MKLTLAIPTMAGGGAERVMCRLANGWVRRGTDVSLVTLGSASDDAYSLDPSVKRLGLELLSLSGNPAAAVFSNLRRVKQLRATLRELSPDVLISFTTSLNVLSILAANQLGVPVVVSERVAPEAYPLAPIWRFLRRYSYRRASAVVAQTKRTATWLKKEVPAAAIEVIGNPVHVEPEGIADAPAKAALGADGCKVVLAAGRLDSQKGFDLLLRAFAVVAHRRSDWRLVILGEGPDRIALRALSRELDISERVMLPGFSRALNMVMRKSQLFVLSSRYEGMPNVLAEAMACGVPCISFDCPTGPAELISHERNGLLVPGEDVTRLAIAIDRLMGSRELRQRLGRAAQESVRPYSVESILDQWDTLLTTVLNARHHGGRRRAETSFANGTL